MRDVLSRMRAILLLGALVSAGSLLFVVGSSLGGTDRSADSPITVMTINHANVSSSAFPEFGWVATAYSKWVNSTGGLVDGNGIKHPLKVLICDDQNDANQLGNCGRQAVSSKVTAIVSAESLYDNSIIPLMESSKIAWFGDCCAFLPITEQSQVSFPTGSAFILNVGQGVLAGKSCKKAAFVTLQSPFASSSEKAFMNGQKSQGKTNAHIVELPPTATDYSAQVAQILSGSPDCIAAVGLGQANWFALLPALKQAGSTQRIISANASLAGVPPAFPAQFENALTVGLYPDYNGLSFANYRAALQKYLPGVKGDWTGIAAEATWTAYTQFANVVKMIKGPVNNQTFLAKAQTTKQLLSDGLAPTLNFTKPFKGGGQPRLFNRSVTFFTIKSGRFIQVDRQFHDLTRAFFGLPQTVKINGK